MQLNLLLDSIKHYAEGIFNISVIYTSSSDQFAIGYEKLIWAENDRVNWIREASFERDVQKALESDLQYTCFFTDDDVLFRPVSESEMTGALADENVICFSMRLGKNTVYCYALDTENSLMEFEESAGLIKFDWSHHPADYGYPLSLDGHVFRTNEITRMTKVISFSNPNTYEANLQVFRDDLPRKMTSYARSALVGVPANKVQRVFDNRYGDEFYFSTSDLNTRYLSGERIDLSAMDFSVIDGCHQELDYKFGPSAN
jgi:hypothetical protein